MSLSSSAITAGGLASRKAKAKYDDLEKRLAAFPAITVPTITMEGDANGAPQMHSGHWVALAPEASVANDPSETSRPCYIVALAPLLMHRVVDRRRPPLIANVF
jgi:hypothetical protein